MGGREGEREDLNNMRQAHLLMFYVILNMLAKNGRGKRKELIRSSIAQSVLN